MPKNEDGEFELILGNRQLLGMFFIVVMLFGVFFVMGYIVGQNSGPQSHVDVASAKKPEVKPLVVNPPEQSSDQPAESAPAASIPVQTASQRPAETPAKPAPEPSKPAPAPKADSKPAPVTNQPVAGARYLQLAAIDKDHADSLVDLLREKGFKALDAEVPEKPGVFRVLVGPVKDGEMTKLRADLQAKSFPGNAGVPKVF